MSEPTIDYADEYRCECDRPLGDAFEWVHAWMAHADFACTWSPFAPCEWGARCLACIRELGLTRCAACHLTWPDGRILEQDDVLAFVPVEASA